MSPSTGSIIFKVNLQFCLDKSWNNFTICRYQHAESQLLNPVFAATNNKSIGQVHSKSGYITCVKDHHIYNIMRAACIEAYPDPNHYCHIRITGILALST